MREAQFSVIVPVYNAENYLHVCVDSVLAQTWKDYEVLLVDDGSCDASGSICDEYAQKHQNVVVIHQENQGQLSARRTGLKHAQGQFVCFVDSDDFIHPELLEKVAKIIKSIPVDVITFKWNQVDLHGQLLEEETPVFAEGEVSKEKYFQKMLSSLALNSLCKRICKRSLFDVNVDYSKYFDIQNGEDLLQSIPVICNAENFYYLNEAFYYYRTNPDSITHQYNKEEYKVLNVIRPALYNCMLYLGYNTETNTKLFFKFYLRSVWHKLYRLCINGAFDQMVLEEIYKFPLIKNSEKYCYLLNRRQRLGLHLFYHKAWRVMKYYFRIENAVIACFGRRKYMF